MGTILRGIFVHPEPQTDFGEGDVILVYDPGPLKGKYTLAVAKEVNLSKDGIGRSYTVKYKVADSKDVVRRFSVKKVMIFKLSVTRLMLLLLMEVQGKTLPVRKGLIVSSMIMLNVSTLDNVMIVDMLNDAS